MLASLRRDGVGLSGSLDALLHLLLQNITQLDDRALLKFPVQKGFEVVGGFGEQTARSEQRLSFLRKIEENVAVGQVRGVVDRQISKVGFPLYVNALLSAFSECVVVQVSIWKHRPV